MFLKLSKKMLILNFFKTKKRKISQFFYKRVPPRVPLCHKAEDNLQSNSDFRRKFCKFSKKMKWWWLLEDGKIRSESKESGNAKRLGFGFELIHGRFLLVFCFWHLFTFPNYYSFWVIFYNWYLYLRTYVQWVKTC